jgi:hypothetical protein
MSWQAADKFLTVFTREEYSLWKTTVDGVTVYLCSKEKPADDQTSGYFKASAALSQKGL